MALEVPTILLIDSYDSFSHNLAALCRRSIPNCRIHIIKNDEFTLDQLLPHLPYFSAIIVGPGPGSPDVDQDIGVVRHLWKLKEQYLLPIFGVCLGLQSLAIESGAQLRRLNVVKHGQLSHINHTGRDLFHGVGSVRAVRYHSLHVVDLSHVGEIEELGWADDDENGKVVMAVRHTSRPFWAVQYHPESVCTQGGGLEVLSNFWKLAQQWSIKTARQTSRWNVDIIKNVGTEWPFIRTLPISRPFSDPLPTVTTAVVNIPSLTTVDVCEHLGVCNEHSKFVALDSAAHPGRFSIIGSLTSESLHVSYYVGEASIFLTKGDNTVSHDLRSQDVWQWLANYMFKRKAQGGHSLVPFWGGFIGYLSYEMGYPTLQVPLPKHRGRRHPDVNFVFVERSVVIDNTTKDVYVQSLLADDREWVQRICNELANLPSSKSTTKRRTSVLSLSPISTVTLPDRERYISRIRQAKEHLYAGDSYELCLTAQTRISIPHHQGKFTSTSTSWERYKSLRKSNPAPHSAYLRLHPTTLLSSSPERFLSFSRPPNSICQLRPIKGTVRKAPGITRSVAEKALAGSAKEVAENLMIVDLIRHDLHGVLGDDVTVSKFCGVEEYETVWQLVSVIEGKQSEESISTINGDDQLGWNVLQRSLPPGSMTGAPKKRSVEILQNLEDGERGVYSGVFGYWCVGGGGDWSVTIRSCFKYDDLSTRMPREATKADFSANEEWVIGAGGAITALSSAEAEWDEMILKLQSVLKSFGITPPMSST